MHNVIWAYLLVVNVVTFIAFGVDKRKAKHNKWRIAEKTLLMLAAIGGSVGALIAMRVFHHKTKHKKFYIGVPVIILLQIVFAIWILAKLSQTPMLI